jgi:magnesium-transporting ATPase (P-type)
MIEAILCFAGFILIFMLSGYTKEIGLSLLSNITIPEGWKLSLSFAEAILLASTVYHAGVIMAQIGNAFACRSDRARSSNLGWLSNKYLLVGVLFELAGILGIIYIPFLAEIFNHVPLPAWMWAGLALYALSLYTIEWIRKAIYRVSIKRRNHEKPSTLSLQEVNQ